VLQYAGDNLLAAFGAERRQEDDAERAVHCGLALLAEGRALGERVQATYGHEGCNVRVGIHTGPVLLGGGVDEDGTIRGLSVNIAARMEQTAPVGAMRISHDTWLQVRGVFEVEVQPPLMVKGRDEPLLTYLVQRAKPRAFRVETRGIEGVATPLVGRADEMTQLAAQLDAAVAKRSVHDPVLIGEPGMGKSRLLHELQGLLETHTQRFWLLLGRAPLGARLQPYGLLRNLLAWRLQIADSDPSDVAKAKLVEGVRPWLGDDQAEAKAHRIGALIGLDFADSPHVVGLEPRLLRTLGFSALRAWMRGLAGEGAVLAMLLEDLQWADDASLDFVAELLSGRAMPLVLVATARPELLERRPKWGEGAATHRLLRLAALDERQGEALASALLARADVGLKEGLNEGADEGASDAATGVQALRTLLIAQAGGNPFYMEELVRMLIDQGAIGTGEAWSVDAQRLLVTHVPPTLTGVLQARLDGLPTLEKRALQQASIVGAVFWDRALAAIEPKAAEQLPALQQRELTLPRPDSPLEGLREYAFRHQVLHQVTYDGVLKRHRREGHAKVAQWLAGLADQSSARSGDLLGLAAEHFERAEDAGNAAEFHARAAEHAGKRLAHDRVLDHVGRALAMLGSSAAEAPAHLRWRLLLTRETTLGLQGLRDPQADDLDALERLADVQDDDGQRAEVAHRRALHAMRMADWAGVESAARHGLACATRLGDEALELRSLRSRATAQVCSGDIDNGRALARRCLAEARRLGLRDLEARFGNILAVAAAMQDDAHGAIALEQESLLVHRQMGDRINEAITLANLGSNWQSLGNMAQARRDLEAALRLLRANGDRHVEASALSHLSLQALLDGEETRALALARQSLEIAHATQSFDWAVVAAMRLGDAEAALGRLAPARQAFENAIAIAQEHSPGDAVVHDASAGLARVALAEGDTAAALAALQPLFEHVDAGGTLEGTDFPRWIELTAHQVLAGAGDPRADVWLERAHANLMARAVSIERSGGAGMRDGFLRNLPWHRQIVEARERREAAAGEGR